MGSIKIGNSDITLKLGSSAVTAAYIGSTLVYSGDTPTPPTPTFQGKWLATYSDSSTASGDCDSDDYLDYDIPTTNLVSIVVGDCVKGVYGYTFYGCTSLTSFTIGSGVTNFGGGVFYGCTSLTSITIEATTPPFIQGDTFDYSSNCPIYVPAASVEAYKTDSRWSNYVSRIQAIQNS